MRKRSRKNEANEAGKARRREFSQRVQALRKSLGFSQNKLAESLGANRTQIAEWEKGTEKPSSAMLQRMAARAPDLEAKLWFWDNSIEDFAQLKRDLEVDRTLHLARISIPSSPGLVDTGRVKAVPVLRDFQLGESDAIREGRQALYELRLSADCVANARDPIGVVVQQELNLLGRAALPYPLAAGDLLILDRAQAEPPDFIGRRDGRRQMLGLLVPRLPRTLGAPLTGPEIEERMKRTPVYDPRETEEIERSERAHAERHGELPLYEERLAAQRNAEELLWKRIEAPLERPAMLFGFLSEQRASPDLEEELRKDNCWRLIFTAGAYIPDLFRGDPGPGSPVRIPLTDWLEGGQLSRYAPSRPFLNNASIFGAVIGWMGSFSALPPPLKSSPEGK